MTVPATAHSQAAANPAIAGLTEIVAGPPIEGRAYGGLAYKVNARAGQQLTIDLRASGNKPVRIIVAKTTQAGGSTTPLHNSTGRGQVEIITLPTDGLYVVSLMDTSFIPGNFLHTVSLSNGRGEAGATVMADAGDLARKGATAPRTGPIVLGSVGAAPVVRPAAPSDAPVAKTARGPSGGPIVLAAAPPPAAAIREAPRPTAGSPAGAAAPTTREALMAAQTAARREQAAREAEAERQRLAQIAEAARIAEANRRAQAAADAASRNEMFAFVGAVLGGVAVGTQTGGDMAGISAGMALGSSLVAPESDIAAAGQQMAQAEMQRLEEQRAREAAIIAELNNPNNPLTQEASRREEARKAREEAEQARIETELNERREEDDRQALLEKRMAEAEETRERQAELQEQQEARDAARQEQQRREEAQREREAQRAREEQARLQAEERQRREQADREAEARRQEQERQRAAAEAERNRVIDFKEAVVLCSLTGPQAQFNNWRCEGPLQMTYVNFEQPNVAFHFDQMSCASYRELPRAGPYRAFGCGYGIHPTNPGAARNVPEMLGVFVDGRATFRCPRSFTGACRNR